MAAMLNFGYEHAPIYAPELQLDFNCYGFVTIVKIRTTAANSVALFTGIL
jgi:hypothetical protein